MTNSKTRLLKALAIGFAFILAALIIVPGIFYMFSISESHIPFALYSIIYLTSFIVGVNASKNAPDKGYLSGLISGLSFGAVYTVISIFLNSTEPLSLVIKLLTILIISTFGGIIGINLKKKKRN